MDNYLEMLRYQCNQQIMFYAFLAVLTVVLACLCYKNQRELFYLLCMAALILVIMFCATVLPAVSDVKNESIVTTEVEWYSRYPNGGNRHNWFDRGHVIIFTNGKKTQLELPYGNTEENFPMGKYTGTVVYAEHSKIILYFKPDEPIEPKGSR